MAITKQRKEELVSQYSEWMSHSQALFLTEYLGLTMKDLDALRLKLRENGAEFHIIKNTLGKLALEKTGMPVLQEYVEGSTAIIFAFRDPPAVAKAVLEFTKSVEALKIKGGYLGKNPVRAEGVRSLAELPPLPVVRSQLLGTILAPASRLVRTLAEPGRQIAAVIKAHAGPESANATA